MKKILKRNRRRKVAQGIGAAAGVAAWALMIGAVVAGEKKLDEYKTKFEDVKKRKTLLFDKVFCYGGLYNEI